MTVRELGGLEEVNPHPFQMPSSYELKSHECQLKLMGNKKIQQTSIGAASVSLIFIHDRGILIGGCDGSGGGLYRISDRCGGW